MEEIKFYDVSKEYIKYLKGYDIKIPNINYSKYEKFVCGVVLEINELNYFAPISSFKTQQRTNILINNEDGVPISSIRFSFMFPAPSEVLIIKDFNTEKEKYKYLLMAEHDFCNKNKKEIYKKAEYIYKRAIGEHDLVMKQNCCDFKLLEIKCREYKI